MNATRSTRRRLTLAVAVVILVVGVFVFRLVDIQVVQADELNKQSYDKRAVAMKTYAPRGDIVDANGVELATSVTRFDITMAPVNIKSFERKNTDGSRTSVSVQQQANEIAAITKQDPAAVFSAMTKDPKSNYTMVAKTVDTATLRAIQKLGIPGIVPVNHPVRIYPNGQVAGNIAGFVGTDGPQNGIETVEQKCLKSTDGSSTYERGADGVQIPGSTVTSTTAKPGGTVKLTIDRDLNWFMQQAISQQAQAIGAVSATAITVRVKDAALMGVADWPSVDPNDVNATAKDHPEYLGSKAFSDYYEPGSTMKGLTASMLIDSGAATPTTGVDVPSKWTSPEGHTISDATPHADEKLTLTGVLEQSSNVGISQLAVKASQKTRFAYLQKYGFGTPTAVNFQGESPYAITPLPWSDSSKYDIAYGQGIAVTAMQLVDAYQGLANGGVRVPLKLVEGCTAPDGTVTDVPSTTGTRVVSEQTSKTVVNMLESVVAGGDLSSLASIPGYRVAGKSGTAEVARPTGGYGGDRIVSFMGIAPAEDPQYIVLVTYTKPTTMKTSAAAAPTFKKIMTEVLTKYRVPPSTTPSTYPATTW
ncbi:peptidoglycan D,D-transpeptidase FtsI family protein [Lacisediminihabitans changchengi]|uniref:Penicillin-binding protein 2 n=1 Tax=Lacisediminihabitans changchengi TaxID=2787634 RepID=A0A934SJF9_9MICO|nr:penicillin-binding protein 2 [Lacisediminihabitans changchengi]MBK4347751.1 penicillin-binding protein 2 [Lacisediminihabitans changchengi]